METNSNLTAVMLTDELIVTYAGDNLITNYVDVNLNYTTQLKPYKGSVLDAKIFGSMFSTQCNCGMVRTVGRHCTHCGSTLLDETEAFKRYGRIELPVYYCSDVKFKGFIKYIKSIFPRIEKDYSESFSNQRGLSKKVFDTLQFTYEEETNTLIISEDIDDYTKCSYDGLLLIFMKYFPSEVGNLFKFINQNILVVPIIMRAPRLEWDNGNRKLKMHRVTTVYQNIIYAVYDFYNKQVEPNSNNQVELALLRACLRVFITKSIDQISTLLKGSKANGARNMQSTRLPNSGRCTIIPGPDLKVDQVKIPVHLMYEACRKEFIDYIASEMEISQAKAELLYRTEATSEEIQRLFSDFVNGTDKTPGKYVIINRNPTLHEYNMMACKVILTRDYTMSIPLGLCQPFGADFDGDTMSFYVIPSEVQSSIIECMSPKNMVYYKKSLDPLFLPNHEVMNGLIIATKVIRTQDILTFASVEDAEQARRKRQIKYQTVIMIDGKQTTLARKILSDLFGTDLDEVLNGVDNPLNSKDVVPLISKLSDFTDRTDRIQKIQEFALKVITIAGISAPKLSELYSSIDKEFKDKVKDVLESPILSENEKSVKVRAIYEEYVKSETNKLDKELVVRIQESSRAKINQLLAITLPQLNVGVDGDVTVSDSTIINGMSPRDYERHATENRAVQDIKVQSVPLSGNLTRQFVYLGCSYQYQEGTDDTNPGILVKMKSAVGRTMIDGTIITKNNSDELVRVRSVLTSNPKYGTIILSDQISSLIPYKNGSNIGISMISSLTEGITQKALSLKHGGYLFNLDPNSSLIAPEDCTMSLSDQFIILTDKSGKLYKYPRPTNFTSNFKANNEYKSGELIGYAYHIFTPAYNLDCVIKLTSARAITPPKQFARNSVIVSQCYALTDGTVKYVTTPKGALKLVIGNIQYDINPNSMYLYPEGAVVKKGQRICTGVLDMGFLLSHITSTEESYYFFRSQFQELIPGINQEMMEFLYLLITRRTKQGQTVMRGVIRAVHENSSFFTELSFEAPMKTFEKVALDGLQLNDDLFTRSNLGLLLYNSLDTHNGLLT